MSTLEIIDYLQTEAKHSRFNVDTQTLVLKFGRGFKPTQRPRGMKLGPIKKCFANAANLADPDGRFYVEGYAMLLGGVPFHHGWISPDGVHAIDVTLRQNVESCAFFGIMFAPSIFLKFIGQHKPILSPPIHPELILSLATLP